MEISIQVTIKQIVERALFFPSAVGRELGSRRNQLVVALRGLGECFCLGNEVVQLLFVRNLICVGSTIVVQIDDATVLVEHGPLILA